MKTAGKSFKLFNLTFDWLNMLESVYYFAASLQGERIIVFPLGLSLLAMLLVLFVIGVIFALKYTVFRKPIGAVLITLGILEILPFFLLLLGLNDITYFIPFLPLAIIFVEGCITLLGGVFMFNLRKTSSDPSNIT